MASDSSFFSAISPSEPAVVFLVDEILKQETPPTGATVNVFTVDGGIIE